MLTKIDKLDKQIIDELRKDGRIAYGKIAAKLSVSERTISNRIKRLIDKGFLRFQGLINPKMISSKQIILIGIKVTLSKKLNKTAEEISVLPYVNPTIIVTGRYDILVEIFIESSKYTKFLSNHLANIKSVVSTESFITLNCVKQWL